VLDRLLALGRITAHPDHRPPGAFRVVLAIVLAVGLSLGADAALVAVGTRVFPSTVGYDHFQFHDYAKLTVIGIVIAGCAWPLVVRLCATPRWLFLRLAVLVTAVLLLPDVYIWAKGQPAKAVIVLMCMHLAIGIITYNALVRLAPPRPRRTAQRGAMAST
jgi:hypothetical protein